MVGSMAPVLPVWAFLCLSALDRSIAGEEAPPPLPVKDFSKSTAHRVVRVVDGDTVVLSIAGADTTVRLIGVDTPETVDPRRPVGAYGKEASEFTKNLLQGESVWIEGDAGPSGRDRYGRTLAYLFRAPDGLFVNLEIIRQGYGHAYTRFPFRHMDLFRYYERAARAAGKGLWRAGPAPAPSAPATARAPATRVPATRVPAPAATAAPSRPTTVLVTTAGKKYHRSGCRFLGRSPFGMPLAEAVLHHEPCAACRPPVPGRKEDGTKEDRPAP